MDTSSITLNPFSLSLSLSLSLSHSPHSAFVGFKDSTSCHFESASTCQWQLQDGNLTLASTAAPDFPGTDATGESLGYYILGTPFSADAMTVHLVSYPSVSYVCGYSFYYQVHSGVRLVLRTTNGVVWWQSGVVETDGWQYVEVEAGRVPVTVNESVKVEFVMVVVGVWTTQSFAAIDEVTLHFCLPCDFEALGISECNYLCVCKV